MVTRRAVLKGTAAASIGAIAAAHGATPVEAGALDCGFGNLAGGAAASFVKLKDAFNVSIKFDKFAADIFIKEQGTDGVAIFAKFWQKHWEVAPVLELSRNNFPDLKLTDLNFVKIDFQSAGIFMKNSLGNSLVGEISSEAEKMFQKWREIPFDGEVEIIGDIKKEG